MTKNQPKPFFPNGGAPFKPWGEEKFKAANPETNDPNLGCMPEGIPRFMFVPLPMEIFQVPTRVVIIREGTQVMRQIYMNRQHPKDVDPTYSGDSVGKWEGDTLVDDVTIEDPIAYTKPFTAQQVYKLKPAWEIQELVCNENNKYTYQGK